MSDNGTAILESVSKGTTNKGPAKGTGEKADEKDPEQETGQKDQTGLFAQEEAEDEKVLKWRFLAKGPALDSLLAVFGAEAVEGEKQVSFKVKAAGNRELGDVVRALFQKAHAAGVTLADLIKLVNDKAKKQ